MDCASVQELIASGTLTSVNVAASPRFTSAFWTYFEKVRDVHGNFVDFANCKTCKEAIPLHGSSTTSLKRHIKRNGCTDQFNDILNVDASPCSSVSPRTPRNMNKRRINFDTPSIQAKRSRPENSEEVQVAYVELRPNQCTAIKSGVADSILQWVVKDMRPFNIAHSQHFDIVAQTYIDIGAKYGHIEAASITPSDRAISQRVHKLHDQIMQQIMPEVVQAISEGMRHSYIKLNSC